MALNFSRFYLTVFRAKFLTEYEYHQDYIYKVVGFLILMVML